MDLQAAKLSNRRSWSYFTIAAAVCFAVACGLLIGSLVAPDKAGSIHTRAGLAQTNLVHSHVPGG